MAIIWVDIWNIQSSSKAKSLINRYFNVGSYITIVRGTNMNSGVLQYKSENIQHSCIKSRRPNVLSIMVLTELNIIITLLSVAKLIKKLISQDLRSRRKNYTLTCSNAPTVMVTIKLIQPVASFRGTNSTKIGTTKNNKNFAKVEVI